MDSSKLKSYAVQLLIVVAGGCIALYAYDQFNKPKIAPPDTAAATPAK